MKTVIIGHAELFQEFKKYLYKVNRKILATVAYMCGKISLYIFFSNNWSANYESGIVPM